MLSDLKRSWKKLHVYNKNGVCVGEQQSPISSSGDIVYVKVTNMTCVIFVTPNGTNNWLRPQMWQIRSLLSPKCHSCHSSALFQMYLDLLYLYPLYLYRYRYSTVEKFFWQVQYRTVQLKNFWPSTVQNSTAKI